MVFNTHDRTPKIKNKKSIVMMFYGIYALFFAMIFLASVVCSSEVGNILPALLILGPFLILSLIFFILTNDMKKSCVIIEEEYIKAVDFYFGKKFEKTFRKDETAFSLYEALKKDELYFLATGGGVTFGGGEPLLYPEFLKEFRLCCGDKWHLCAETSLNVPTENVYIASECIDMFYVDCKDTNPSIYKSYTGIDNKNMLENLKILLSLVGGDRIVVRVPLIREFNTEQDREKSVALLSEMGITQFDLFEYKTS